MRHISAKMRKLSHSPAAKAKRRASMQRIVVYRKAKGIPSGQKLTAKQKKEARGFYGGKTVAVTGSIPIGELGSRPKAGQAAARRTYLTSRRLDLADDVVGLVKAMRPKEPLLAATFLHVLRQLLNGGH